MFEMAIFCLLIVPLPYTMKRSVFTFIADNPVVAKLQYGLKVHPKKSGPQKEIRKLTYIHQITFIFILILFIDSVNRVYSVQMELAKTKKASKYGRLSTRLRPH